MSAFQKFVEMPLTGRQESYAPAHLAETLLPVHPETQQARTRLNWAAHFGLSVNWGTAYGLAAKAGLRGQKAVNVTSATVYPTELLLSTALGVYHPSSWTAKDWAIDVVDKYVQAQATGFVFDRFLDPAR
ncbi:hypothetical protein [Modestobacter sp. DSM 44400]|uniref:hypothetical protein n=1 Tax=Modestobacter sp. DSM 44400 TaxID=1550230 RepID=UPI0020C8412A|nr:hypothetical protein [Modestobacter sp. DSM 44400]